MLRVVRILEYEYSDVEAMVADQTHWKVPPHGVKVWNPRETVRSTLLPVTVEPDEEEPPT